MALPEASDSAAKWLRMRAAVAALTTAVSASVLAWLMPRTLPKCSTSRCRVRCPTPGMESNRCRGRASRGVSDGR